MQNIILGYADRVRERLTNGATIGEASAAFLRQVPEGTLEQLRRAADDLMRLIELEQERRQEEPRLGEGGSRMVCCGEIR
jgi:ABC-type phosphonate transport system ATPase subunit